MSTNIFKNRFHIKGRVQTPSESLPPVVAPPLPPIVKRTSASEVDASLPPILPSIRPQIPIETQPIPTPSIISTLSNLPGEDVSNADVDGIELINSDEDQIIESLLEGMFEGVDSVVSESNESLDLHIENANLSQQDHDEIEIRSNYYEALAQAINDYIHEELSKFMAGGIGLEELRRDMRDFTSINMVMAFEDFMAPMNADVSEAPNSSLTAMGSLKSPVSATDLPLSYAKYKKIKTLLLTDD